MPINTFFEDIPAVEMEDSSVFPWLEQVIKMENKTLTDLNYIFCSDEYLYQINLEYLSHDYYTDVITFDNTDELGHIEGDIFISIDRVKENSNAHDASFEEELGRIMVHGLLHLIGYNDKTPEEKEVMTEKENAYLSLPQFQLRR